ncbi:MAG: hypothetical protein V3R25_05910 [Nitrosomonadaceae bacterium]
MTDEMKLLMAFIEASGFVVEEVINKQECMFSIGDIDKEFPIRLPGTKEYKVTKKAAHKSELFSPEEIGFTGDFKCGTCYNQKELCNCENKD